MTLRQQLTHPLTAREFRMVALGSQPQLPEQVFGLLIRAIAFSRRDEMLEVVVSQGIGQRGVTLQLVSRIRGEDELATGLRNIEPTRTTRFDAAKQQEAIACQRLLLSIGQHSQLHVSTHGEFVVWHSFALSFVSFHQVGNAD